MNGVNTHSVQQWLRQRGLWPQTRLARFSAAAGAASALTAAWQGHVKFNFFPLCMFLFLGALLWLGYRWFKKHLMWRLSNRLIVTYVFIGVIPLVLLATMGLVACFLFAGQFSTFVVTTDINNELLRLESANRTVAHHAAEALGHGLDARVIHDAIADDAFPGRQVMAYYKGRAELLDGDPAQPFPAPPRDDMPDSSVVLDRGELFLRAVHRSRQDAAAGGLVVVSSVPLDGAHLASVVPNIGVVTVYGEMPAAASTASSEPEIRVDDEAIDLHHPRVICGSVPPPAFRSDFEFDRFGSLLNAGFRSLLSARRWENGRERHLLLTVQTRPSLLYNRLFHTLGELSNAIFILLAVIAVFFALIEVVALVVGIRLTRTMTSSVSKLYDATQYINRGDFSHRIRVKSRDQLAALETSFNSMTESLQKLIAEQKEKQRIESELQIAKEVQDLLFPHDAADLDGLELHGVCRPARTVSGDYYDFLPVSENAVGLAVADISGKGISAALMMATLHAFVRAHTLAEKMPSLALAAGATAAGGNDGVPQDGNGSCCAAPGTVLAMLNQQLYRSTPAQKYATMFLGFYDQPSRRFLYSNAGHLPPLVVCRDGQVHRLEEGGTVVGLFPGMAYPEGSTQLNPGDILVAYSDGITEPENDFGEFGEERLAQIILENRDLPLPRITDAILNAVLDWIGGEEQPDDMTVVIARAR
ncbi:MAG: SpoIIE family protein phosphatase [Acidobacteriota bacterium]|nr:SpoIIE family protein phosphatase [Acidobacteriota bacterium]